MDTKLLSLEITSTLIILLMFLHKSSSLECYVCVGTTSEKDDALPGYQYTVEECNKFTDLSKEKRKPYVKTCPTEATRCKKTVQQIARDVRYAYQCAMHGPKDESGCVRRAGTKGDPILRYCHCTSDLCNRGRRHALTPGVILALIPLVVYNILC